MAKIVVIDDSRLMRRFLRHHLESLGHQVEEWEDLSAAEIPDRIQASGPDLVLTDYMMPGCNGLTVARMVRKTRPDLPVLVLTAHRDPELLDQMHRLGVAEVLHKPVDYAQLEEALRLLL